MEPLLKNNDKIMFYKFLNKADIYFEYGSGGSTYQASLKKNIKKIYTIESDITWQNKLKKNIKNKNITYFYNEMNTIPNTFGHPGKNATDTQKINYSNHIIEINKENNNIISDTFCCLVLIDGRFRVACCLKCYDIINDYSLIAFDDFLNRSEYHIVLEYFDVIEKTEDKRMVILKKKKNVTIPKELIEKYELIRR